MSVINILASDDCMRPMCSVIGVSSASTHPRDSHTRSNRLPRLVGSYPAPARFSRSDPALPWGTGRGHRYGLTVYPMGETGPLTEKAYEVRLKLPLSFQRLLSTTNLDLAQMG
jgi:hypothetical protein